MNRITSALVVAFCFALGNAAPARAENQTLSGDEITVEFSGATIRGEGTDGTPFTVTYEVGGSMSGKSGKYRDRGKWEVDGDLLCRKWHNWSNSRRACFSIRRVEDGFASYDGDKLRTTFKMQ